MDPLSDLYSLCALCSLRLMSRVIRVSRGAGPVPEKSSLPFVYLTLYCFFRYALCALRSAANKVSLI